MSPEQIHAIAKGIAEGVGAPPWWAFVFLIFLAGVAAYLGTYLAEKGRNLATKEDITGVTELIEQVKRQHQAVLENLKAGNLLSMVAAERRLQAHQEAFALWCELYDAMHQPTVNEVAGRCRKWWRESCVYLGPKSHKAFYQAFGAAAVHAQLLASRPPADEIKANWAKITEAPRVILGEVALPSLRVPVEELGRLDWLEEKAPWPSSPE